MAKEVRLIDANGSYTLNECNETGHSLCFGGGFVDVYDPKGKHICQFWAGDAPTVDAVEVVRCKDCKHYGWEQEPCHGSTQRFCRLHKGLVVVDRDTFCSYGERKDNV